MVAIYNRTWKFSFEGNFHFDFNKNNRLFKREDFIFTISLPKYLGGEEKEEKKKKEVKPRARTLNRVQRY